MTVLLQWRRNLGDEAEACYGLLIVKPLRGYILIGTLLVSDAPTRYLHLYREQLCVCGINFSFISRPHIERPKYRLFPTICGTVLMSK